MESVQATEPQQKTSTTRILVVGDSLSAEYGLTRNTGWVWLMQQELTKTHPECEITNASISGDTTSGGLARLSPLLTRVRPNIVIIELGANDALRGLPLNMSQQNISAMIKEAQASGAKVLVTGMQIPPNYGRDYTEAFKKMFEDTTRTNKAVLVPFLLEGIAQNRALFQADGIHPNESAQATIMKNVLTPLLTMLKS